jgi:flagellar biosynthesis/type III secretory pathway chaperone
MTDIAMTDAATDSPSAEHLAQAEALAHELFDMLELEFEQLKAQNLDAFEASQASKNRLLQQLMQLAQISGPDSAESLNSDWYGFKEQITVCRNMHRRNEILISRKIDAIKGALQSLQVFDPASSVEIYDRLGKLSRTRRGRGGYAEA